jgi:ATP-binding protein involved in chromosome partitioning
VSVDIALDPVFPGAPSGAPIRDAVRAAAAAACGAAGLALAGGGARVREVPSRPGGAAFAALGGGLAGLRSAVAVASGKGGVGKSTVSANLAFALAARGARVGLLDADIQGPSLPTMVTPASLEVRKGADGCVGPLDVGAGVAAMSYGWVAPRNAAGERAGAVMRGPMLATVVRQLAKFTAWGARDALVVDTPPGTGDVHLTLGQLLPLAGAVVVTTPQALAMGNTARGLAMLKGLAVPPLALVLNMAFFDDGRGGRHHPLGDGRAAAGALADRWGVPRARVFEVPMEPVVSAAGDGGAPAVVAAPRSATAAVFAALAEAVAGDLEAALGGGGGGGGPLLSAAWDAARGAVAVRWEEGGGAREALLAPRALRAACRCAACEDEFTGARRVDARAIPPNVVPARVEPRGNYGVAVAWSDGHASSIYTHTQLRELAAAKPDSFF